MAELFIKEIVYKAGIVKATIFIDGKSDSIKAEVSQNMQEYVTADRCDAFVIGLMFFSLKYGYDIKSEVPISEELYYNLENHFIDSLAYSGSGFHRIKLSMPTIKDCKRESEIVATGVSCGIDCLYTLSMHENSLIPSFKITHLAFYNVGSHQTGLGFEEDKKLYEGRYNLCKSFAEEYGYTFYTISSDIHDFIQRNGGYSHVSNHSYMAAFCILLLQKGLSKYYYSAGYPYTDFRTFKNYKKEELDSAMYDLLTFYTISIGGLKAYSAGGAVKRIDKTRFLAGYEPAHKYLNVCVRESKNDGTCFKCIRTLLSIDTTGHIDDFSRVFDVEYYKEHRAEFLKKTWLAATFGHDELSQEILPLYKKELSFFFKCHAVIEKFIGAIKRRFYRLKINEIFKVFSSM